MTKPMEITKVDVLPGNIPGPGSVTAKMVIAGIPQRVEISHRAAVEFFAGLAVELRRQAESGQHSAAES